MAVRRTNIIHALVVIGALAGMQCSDMGDEITSPDNRPPELISPTSINITTGQRLLYRARANDPDGGTPAISFENYPSWLTSSADSVFGVTPDGAADTSFLVIASDGSLADTLSVIITISTVNQSPQVTSPDTASAVVMGQFSYRATAIDPDGTTPTITFVGYASWLIPSGDSIYGQTPQGATDTSFQVIASDGLLADTVMVSISIIAGVSYSAQIQPVFTDNCALSGCHMGPAPTGGLRLMSYTHVMNGGVSGPVIIPFEPDSSLLIKRIEGTITPRMPFNGPPYLPDSTIQLIRTWIAQGAQDN